VYTGEAKHVLSECRLYCIKQFNWGTHKKFPLPLHVSGPPPNTWFLGPTRVHNPNGISIGSAVFARLKFVINRQTYRPHYINSNRPHIMLCIEMWPKICATNKCHMSVHLVLTGINLVGMDDNNITITKR